MVSNTLKKKNDKNYFARETAELEDWLKKV